MRKEVTVQTKHGPVEVQAEVFGVWAATPAIEDEGRFSDVFFGITHVPSGRLLGNKTFNSRAAVTELAARLHEECHGPEWETDFEALPKDGQERVRAVFLPWKEDFMAPKIKTMGAR